MNTCNRIVENIFAFEMHWPSAIIGILLFIASLFVMASLMRGGD